LIGLTYVRTVSVGFIINQTHAIGRCAEKVLEKLSCCKQKVARFLLYDETFPKLGKYAWSLGVAIQERKRQLTLKRCLLGKPELCHLHHHHRPELWTCVERVFPDYRECKAWLRANERGLEVGRGRNLGVSSRVNRRSCRILLSKGPSL
jgi:hypothetical protein